MIGRRRARDEEGSALIEVTWLAILLLVPLVYVLISVFDVQRGSFAVSAASRAAGRAYTLADNDEQGRRAAREAARVALADQGLGRSSFDLTISCVPDPGDCFQPESVVTVRVRTQVKLPLAPDVLGSGAASFRLDSVHRVPRGKYVEAPSGSRDE